MQEAYFNETYTVTNYQNEEGLVSFLIVCSIIIYYEI